MVLSFIHSFHVAAPLYADDPQRKIPDISQINRILKPEGSFISQHMTFWEEEEMIWFWGKQDERLYEFGGILTSGKTRQEVVPCITPEGSSVLQSSRKIKEALFHSIKKNPE
ncbi:hypothetical protein ABEI56_21935 [Peribacillus castrilensis]|uniref:hypothetical protein n=1 Tax=Peribacillus castrilensis TaxID=2897690 RepID=UPI003D280571